MPNTQAIFAHYVEARNRGLEGQAALQPLRASIMELPPAERQALARLINTHENKQAQPTPSSAVSPVAQAAEAVAAPVQEATSVVVKRIAATVVKCPRCGKANHQDEALCAGCGNVLKVEQLRCSTRALLHTDDLFFSADYFGSDSTLSLHVRGSTDADLNQSYDVRPQDAGHELVIGRSNTETNVVVPDIDLAPHYAEKRGVSRLHLSLRYDAKHNTISMMDMNSANGTFINGQRLYPNEIRILRSGDELRLGKLVLKVTFYHMTDFSEADFS